VSEPRAAILARLRQALPRDEAAQARARQLVDARLAGHRPNLVPSRGQLEAEPRIELFMTMAAGVQAEVERVAELAAVPAVVSAFLRRHNLPQKLVMAPEPLLDAARFESQPLLRFRRGTASAEDEVGVTLAAAGIAETGTLLLVSGETTPTLLAFMPENSIVVLPSADVDGSYEESWARLRANLGPPPRSANFITGPSRTGDIAQKIELGAHGPRRLLIILVDRLPGDGAESGPAAEHEAARGAEEPAGPGGLANLGAAPAATAPEGGAVAPEDKS
jgi:L-lactate dehydrogenase complex protein LldG